MDAASTRRDPLGPAPDGTPLYVHLPFCAAKCPYCDFFSVAGEGHDVDGMVDAILREAEARAPRSPRTLFLGGGTPSWLDEPVLRRFLDRLDDLTGFRASAVEATAECNPESLDATKAACLHEGGVRRVSIGFQSLDPATLELFGRVHAVDDSFRAFEAARGTGFEAVNIDLIYAAPGQTVEAWTSELARVLALRPDHLAAYNLTFEPGTAFGQWLEQGRMQRAPEEIELALFETVRAETARAGLAAYEISNYARPGQECQHNLNYWLNGPYVGIGPSAVSKVGRRRGGNPRGIPAYRRAIEAGGAAIEWHEEPTGAARLGETWWLGLRLSRGVDPARARASAGWEGDPERDPALATARRLAEVELLEEQGSHWRLTARAIPLADGVAAEFLAPDEDREERGEPGSVR